MSLSLITFVINGKWVVGLEAVGPDWNREVDGKWEMGKKMDRRMGMGWSLHVSCKGWENLLGSCGGWRGAMSQNGAR